tara:strand:- start:854 stop:1312 length:459 start_codon:yes stop_codon:yes gene_type:complete
MNINFFMNEAINEAYKAIVKEEVPIGAVLVDNTNLNIIKTSHNYVNSYKNATMHAEMVVINESCKMRKTKFLKNTSLFVTLEPCAMCAAAISEARIDRVYFGAYDEKKGSLDSIMKIYKNKNIFVPEVYGGINEEICSSLIKNFFKEKRVTK